MVHGALGLKSLEEQIFQILFLEHQEMDTTLQERF